MKNNNKTKIFLILAMGILIGGILVYPESNVGGGVNIHETPQISTPGMPDLNVYDIFSNDNLYTQTDITISVIVKNDGWDTASNFNVQLLIDGVHFNNISVAALDKDKNITVDFINVNIMVAAIVNLTVFLNEIDNDYDDTNNIGSEAWQWVVDPNASSDDPGDDDGLSTGAYVGISGAVVAVIAIVLLKMKK